MNSIRNAAAKTSMTVPEKRSNQSTAGPRRYRRRRVAAPARNRNHSHDELITPTANQARDPGGEEDGACEQQRSAGGGRGGQQSRHPSGACDDQGCVAAPGCDDGPDRAAEADGQPLADDEDVLRADWCDQAGSQGKTRKV